MKLIRDYISKLYIINISNICNDYINVKILMTQSFPKVYIC